MRKVISVLFFLLCLLSLPGLIAAIKRGGDTSVLIGQGVFSLIMLVLGFHFWKPATPKEKK